MRRYKVLAQQSGNVLLLVVVILVAVSALGVTMITLGKNQVDMATNQKLKEIARYNCDSCSVAVSKLIRLIVDASNEGTIGITAGGPTAPGIVYPQSPSGDPAAEFARKVLYGDDSTGICEDVSFAPQDIADALETASSGDFTIDSSRELDAAADLRSTIVTSIAGTASREFAAGQGHGLGEGGAGGGGMMMKFVIACRGRAPNNALHVGYSVYRKTLGVGKGN